MFTIKRYFSSNMWKKNFFNFLPPGKRKDKVKIKKKDKPTMFVLKVFQIIGKRFLELRQTLKHRWATRANAATTAVTQQEDETAMAGSQRKVTRNMSFHSRWMSMGQFNILPWTTKNQLNIWSNDFKILAIGSAEQLFLREKKQIRWALLVS